MTRRSFLRLALFAPLLGLLPTPSRASPVCVVDSIKGGVFNAPVTIWTKGPAYICDSSFTLPSGYVGPMIVFNEYRGGAK